ncbi:hypothetical protein OQH60_08495, partial [Campylobacter sp. MIT 21-1685]|nr:hypothetical protein [Campylobacter sp. MIT 21-1684]MCX2752176.1 hypothetical protein [Campylobacter sp. MIT 21-1682]MCX2808372.1 hypothetical protein [Campylobacter sp. MIT 21-1685]
LKSGLIEEAKELFSTFPPKLKALNCIGLKECKAYLDNKISLKELEMYITTHTSQLAKKQRTFNKQFQSTALDCDTALAFLKKKLKSSKNDTQERVLEET